MKKYIIAILAAVLASAASAKVSQDKLRVFQDKIAYSNAYSGWHREMQRVQRCARAEDPFLKDQLPLAISHEMTHWICYTNTAQRVLSSADGRLKAKILERLEKDKSARPQICIDAEKALALESRLRQQQAKQEKQAAKRQTTNLFKPTVWKKVTFKTERVSRLPGTKAEPRRLSGKLVER